MPIRAEYTLVASIVFAGITAAQSPAPRKLGAPTMSLDQEFTGIDGVFELKDGRIIVLDSREKSIYLIDTKTKVAKKVGREGEGPGEFSLPVDIWPSSGDSALIRDFGRFAKLMVLTPQGELGGYVSMLDSALSTRSFQPEFVDRSGRVYGLERTALGSFDSARVVRWDRAKGTRDTVTRFFMSVAPPSPLNEADVFRDKDGRIMGYRRAARPRAFVPYNEWAVGGDGRVAIVRAAPYQVILIGLDGKRVTGPVVPMKPVAVTQAEKDEWIAERSKPGPSVSMSNGVTTTQYMKPRPIGEVDWGDVLPPFISRSVRFGADGMLWVRRSVKAGAPALYDVFDRGAKLAYQLELPARRKLVAFGAGVVYLARVDDDDLHYLERYSLLKP